MMLVRWLFITLLALAVGGCAPAPTRPPTALSTQAAPTTTTAPATAPPSAPAPVRSEPVRIDIPRIDAHSSLVPLGLAADGTVQVPPVSKPLQAGWFSGGPAPGEAGPAVLLGHVDGDHQRGIFYRLHELRPGDAIDIARVDGGTLHFEVSTVDQIAKAAFPTEAVYGDTAGPELRLITCGGSFDRTAHSYRDNIIVYAVLR